MTFEELGIELVITNDSHYLRRENVQLILAKKNIIVRYEIYMKR